MLRTLRPGPRAGVLKVLLLVLPLLLASLPGMAQRAVFPEVKVDTSLGSFTLRLDSRRAPLTTANFLEYVESGFYEGTIFHRVIPGFMAQGGGFTTDLRQKSTRDPVPNESGNGLTNDIGTIAMARTNDPHSATAQFYINLVDNPALDPNPSRWGYAVFGRVVDGMDTLEKIAEVPTGPRGRLPRDVPMSNILIEKMTLLPPR